MFLHVPHPHPHRGNGWLPLLSVAILRVRSRVTEYGSALCAMTRYRVDNVVVMMAMISNGKDGRSGGIQFWTVSTKCISTFSILIVKTLKTT
jgi:hypothetical protein